MAVITLSTAAGVLLSSPHRTPCMLPSKLWRSVLGISGFLESSALAARWQLTMQPARNTQRTCFNLSPHQLSARRQCEEQPKLLRKETPLPSVPFHRLLCYNPLSTSLIHLIWAQGSGVCVNLCVCGCSCDWIERWWKSSRVRIFNHSSILPHN